MSICSYSALLKDYYYICTCAHTCALTCARARGGQKNVLDPWELKLQVTVSCPMWLLGTELRPS